MRDNPIPEDFPPDGECPVCGEPTEENAYCSDRCFKTDFIEAELLADGCDEACYYHCTKGEMKNPSCLKQAKS